MSQDKDLTQYMALKTILISQCLLEHHDELKGGAHWRGRVAGALRSLSIAINIEYKHTVEKLYEIDDETAMLLSKNYDLLFENLPHLSFEDLNEVAELVQQKAQKS